MLLFQVPFKDDFWSEETQPGNRWGTNTAREADAELQTVVSALTAGEMRGRGRGGRGGRGRGGRGRGRGRGGRERKRERRRQRVVLCVMVDYATPMNLLATNTNESPCEWQDRWDQRAGWGILTAPVSCRHAPWTARSSSPSHRRGSLIQRTSTSSLTKHKVPALTGLTGRMGSNASRRTTTLSVSNLSGEQRWAWGPWRLWMMHAYPHHRHLHHHHRHRHRHRHRRHRHRHCHRSTT